MRLRGRGSLHEFFDEYGKNEPIEAIYSSASGHLAPDGGHFACGVCRVCAAAGVGAAAGGLSDDSGADVLSGREPRGDGVVGDGAAGAAVRQVPGLNQMTSTSSGGGSRDHAAVLLELNIDVAEQEVQAAINAASTYLPKDLPNPPIYSKVNPADTPILTLALTSDTMPLSKVEDLADTRAGAEDLAAVGRGLGERSAEDRSRRCAFRRIRRRCPRYGLSLEDLRTALVAANVNQAKGNLRRAARSLTRSARTIRLLEQRDYKPLIVAYRNGAPVRLSDVANVVDGAENLTAGRLDERQRQRGDCEHSAATGREHHRRGGRGEEDSAAAASRRCRPTVKSQVLTDRTKTIRASVKDVKFELVLTIGLVVLVIFLFLRSFAATVIPSVAVPLSIVGTFGVMYLLGYSLNNLSLMALTISTGFRGR